MKLLVSVTAIIMLSSLSIISVINLFVNPVWMIAMIAYSMGFIYMIAKDIAIDTKKIKTFTMLELMAVITLMAILLGIASQAIKPDRAAAAIKQVGGSISIWSAKAMADDTSYRMEFTKNLLEVYNEDNVLIHSLKIISDLTFVDHSGNPKTNQTIVFNKMGGMNDLQGTKIYADEWVARVNGFTGHLAYYDDEEED